MEAGGVISGYKSIHFYPPHGSSGGNGVSAFAQNFPSSTYKTVSKTETTFGQTPAPRVANAYLQSVDR